MSEWAALCYPHFVIVFFSTRRSFVLLVDFVLLVYLFPDMGLNIMLETRPRDYKTFFKLNPRLA